MVRDGRRAFPIGGNGIMRVLITGASGFLGGYVVEALNQEGMEIVVMARRTSDLSPIEGRVDEVRYGDLTDLDSIVNASRDTDVAIHCAGAVKMVTPYSELRETNVEGTRKVVQACAKNGVGRIIYASSLGVHGMGSNGRRPKEKYCRSKAEAERAFFEECTKGEVEGVALRPGVIYGPRDFTASYPMFKMVESGNTFLIGDGDTRFPLIYIDDLVRVFKTCLDSTSAAGESFDLTGEEVTSRNVFQTISGSLGVDFDPRFVSYRMAMMAARMGEIRSALGGYRKEAPLSRFVVQLYGLDHNIVSEKACEILGFEPMTGLEEGIRRTAEWYLSIQGRSG